MTMPKELVFIRHGQSEANVIQKADKRGEPHAKMRQVNDRPDWQQRLTPLGVEQAKRTKEWIDRHLGGAASFDLRYTTSFLRGRETAAYIGGEDCGEWRIDDRLIERDWGHYGLVPESEREEKFALTKRMYEQSPFYTRLDGGQSRADLILPVRDFFDTLHREASDKRVMVVAHGDLMGAVRYVLERMLPEEFEAMERDRAQTVGNACLLIYARTNPEDTSDIRENMTWRRMVNPVNPKKSPFGGEWVQLPPRPKYTGAELLAQAEKVPRLLTPEE